MTTDSLPSWIVDLPRLTLFTIGGIEIRAMVALAIAIVVVFQLAISYLNIGRRFYAIGSNPEAAELIGLPARGIVFTAFLLSGALAGTAGFMTLARFGNITVEAGIGLELQVVAAVVVGGVNIFGGSGTVIGAMLGAVMIGILEQSLFRLQISQFWLDALLGFLILLAVASDAVILHACGRCGAAPSCGLSPNRRRRATLADRSRGREAADGSASAAAGPRKRGHLQRHGPARRFLDVVEMDVHCTAACSGSWPAMACTMRL